MYKKIIIDAGHGGLDNGTPASPNWYEKQINLKMALEVERLLIEANYSPLMVRREDITVSPKDRAESVKVSGADLCFSIHANANRNKDVKGIEIIRSIYNKTGEAQEIADKLANYTGLTVNRVFSRTLPDNKAKDYYYMHRTTGAVTTYILEVGYASNADDEAYISEHWRDIANAIFKIVTDMVEGGETEMEETKTFDWKAILKSYPTWAGAISLFIMTAETWGFVSILPAGFEDWLMKILSFVVLAGVLNNPTTKGLRP